MMQFTKDHATLSNKCIIHNGLSGDNEIVNDKTTLALASPVFVGGYTTKEITQKMDPDDHKSLHKKFFKSMNQTILPSLSENDGM